MSHLPDEFRDPGFRSAVQRAVGKETAPTPLRDKVAALLTASGATESSTPRDRRRFWPGMPALTLRFVGLAALVMLAVGWAAVEIREFVDDGAPHGTAAAPATISASLASAMVRTHYDCAKLADHHQLPGDDLKALQTPLTSSAGVNAFSAPLGEGWQFEGAGVYTVGSKKAAELFFVRGTQTASIFSMQADASACGENACLSQVIDHSALAAVTNGSVMYAVVVSQQAGEPAPAVALAMLQKVEITIFGGTLGCPSAAPATATAPATNNR